MDDVFGNIAAGTLGFIAGDVPGAFAGVSAYNALKDWEKVYQKNQSGMAKRKGSASSSGGKTKKRKGSVGTVGTKSSGMSKSSYRKKVSKSMRGNVDQSAKTATHNKVKDTLKDKKPYQVKVSKAFRKKVIKTLTENKVKGVARLFKFGGYFALDNNGLNGRGLGDQWVFALPTGDTSMQNAGGNRQWGKIRWGDAQSILEQLYCVSRLFNDCAKQTSQINVTYGLQDIFQDPTETIDGLRRSALKYEILKSNTLIHIKNVSKVTVFLEMYVCKPKVQRDNKFEYDQFACTAIHDWKDALVTDLETQVAGNTNNGLTATITGKNVSQVSCNDLGVRPEKQPIWTKLWSYEKFLITLEPGQRHVHTIVGETGVCDWSKFYKDNTFNNLQRFDRQEKRRDKGIRRRKRKK